MDTNITVGYQNPGVGGPESHKAVNVRMLHAESLTAAVSCLGALHDVSEHLLHHLAVGKTAAIALALPLSLQALVRMKQQH